MELDPRTPVLVGAGQTTSRPGDSLVDRPEPVELIARSLEAAAEDCAGNGAGRRLLERAQCLWILPPLAWKYANPGLLAAERLGIEPAEIGLGSIGGNGPQLLANRAASAISEGRLDAVLIAGADCIGSRVAARRDLDHPPLAWTTQPASTPEPVRLDEETDPVTALELAAGLDRPLRVFPLFANALRYASGRSIEEDARYVSGMWAQFSDVAAKNLYAWGQTPRTAEEIATVSGSNRMVSFPYTKLEVANDRVDMGAAFILCSVQAARDAGVPAERMIFPLSGSRADDHWYLTHRMDLHSSPAIRAASRTALELAKIGIDDAEHLDIYSCFPCAVQMAAAEIGLPVGDPSRPLTLTGGLGFAGGPGNNYVSHSIATMASALRSGGGKAVITGLGWYATKHSIGVWSADPPEVAFADESAQSEVDATPQRSAPPIGEDPVEGVVETYTVIVGRDGSPELGIVAVLTEEGTRTWANISDTDLNAALMAEEGCGRRARIRDGRVEIR